MSSATLRSRRGGSVVSRTDATETRGVTTRLPRRDDESAAAFCCASSERLVYAKSLRSAASRITASGSVPDAPEPDPLAEGAVSEAVSEAVSASEAEETPRSDRRRARPPSSPSASLALAESWPTMICASDRPESTDAARANGERGRLGDRADDPSEPRERSVAEAPGKGAAPEDAETFPDDPDADGTCGEGGLTCPRDAW